jgi:hypothetical protein
MTNPHIGSSFDDFMRDQGILADATAVASRRVAEWSVESIWKQAFIDERARTYRAESMKIEQARIHAETDAALADISLGRNAKH